MVKNASPWKLPCTILELGAGTGRLSHFLNLELQRMLSSECLYELFAADDGSWRMPYRFSIVETFDYREALRIYEPDMVLVSWMPHQVDWSEAIRRSPKCKEYILIGEKGGCTGAEWETWGENWDHTGEEIPYRRDGYQMKFLEKISNLQINLRTEYQGHCINSNHSQTFSFRRGRNGVG